MILAGEQADTLEPFAATAAVGCMERTVGLMALQPEVFSSEPRLYLLSTISFEGLDKRKVEGVHITCGVQWPADLTAICRRVFYICVQYII